MPETTSDQDQLAKSPSGSEAAQPQPAPQAPELDWETSQPALSLGPGLGSPDGFEERVADSRQQRSANRQNRVQNVMAMQRQFGNGRVQRFMIQRRGAGGPMPVQRQGDKDKEDAGTLKIDENGVTTANYNPPSMTTSNETPTPSADAKPGEDKVDVTATVTAVFKVATNVSLPAVPPGLTKCQTQRVQAAIKQLSAHEDQHVAAMKQYDGTFTTTVTVKGVTRAAAPAALIAAAKPAVDAEGASRKKTAQDASDKLDQPPFVINVDLNCEDDKPGKKAAGDTGAQPEMVAGGEPTNTAAEGAPPPTEAA